MDASDLFKKLSRGTSFKTKNKVKTLKPPPFIKLEPLASNEVKSRKRKREDVGKSGNVQENGQALQLLDNLVASQFDSVFATKTKKKKSKRDEKDVDKEKLAELRNRNHISVIGKKVPMPVETFEDFREKLKLSSVITKNLINSNYSAPTPIQMQTVPLLMEGRQVLACAPTGSGKTAAFLVPILHQLRAPKKGGFRAVVVSPTRELAAQSLRECQRLSEGTGIRSILISKISHTSDDKFNEKANTTFDILFTTPNRLVHLLQQEPPVISLKKVEWLIVDECDKLFEAGVRGFRDQLAVIYTACESVTVKRAMFSATQSPPLTKWCRKNLKNVVTINVGIRNTSCDDVEQELLFVGSEAGKLVAFRALVQKGLTPPVLVFVQSKERAQELFNELLYDGINVDVIHSDRTQTQRDNVIRCFREGKIWVLICTELMGRGIDFKGVNLVVNYDFPPSTVAYIHRVGRTGRAGRKGKAITYFTIDDTANLRSIAHIVKEAGGNVPDYMLSLKKPSKREKKDMERRAPEREPITTTPVYEEIMQRKKMNAIKRSKRKKNAQNVAK